MALKVKIARPDSSANRRGKTVHFSLRDPIVLAALIAFTLVALVSLSFFTYYYIKYDRIVERRMSGQVFSNAARVYALPHSVWVGEKVEAREIASDLRRSGYSSGDGKDGISKIGEYRLLQGGVEIRPGPESYHSQDGAVIRINAGEVQRIASLGGPTDGRELSSYELEPRLVTALDTEQRAKRQLVRYQDIPKVMVDAVLAIEDRRYFQHGGVNFIRLFEAALIDLRSRRHEQGGSTLTMQVSRAFFLSPEKTYKRKLAEILIAFELEHKFSKQQIFELYANQVDMGQRGSYTIEGFAEAARSYFNKDLQNLTLPEAALLAGLIQAPSRLSPYRHPERALERRNLVLESMVETGAITREQADQAKATALKLAPLNVEASDAPYFVDLVKDTLSSHYGEREINEQALRIYTTLDPELQRVAAEAVEEGIKLVDDQITKRRTKRVKGPNGKMQSVVAAGPQAQVSMVVMDPRTGNVLALVGGRNYGFSQLNHAVAKRPTGSIFKPFVYAAAMNTALAGGDNVLTPASLIDDSPTTFTYEDKIYEPRNYQERYHGLVTARYALAESLNNATVKLAEMVGYDKVAELAKAAGIHSVLATPAMALGAYDATPLEMTAAYTVFSNNGVRLSPVLVTSVRDAQGQLLDNFQTQQTPVLDPRVAYVMTNMMEGVLNFGTAAGVRARGFTAPAAGKTGTSHDGWFAGYTSNLLCVVWVGFDDYSDLKLAGSATAAPIWAEFMKRAITLPGYRDVQPFTPPTGVVAVELDKITNRLATPTCPETYTAAFLAGTEPTQTCDQSGDTRNMFSRILGLGNPQPLPPPTTNGPVGSAPTTAASAPQPPQPQDDKSKKKKGFFGKILGIFQNDDTQQKPPPPPQQPPNR